MNYKSKSNYIVFVSEFVRPDQLNKNYDYNTYYSREKKILPILEKFCIDNDLILRILCRNKLEKNFKKRRKKSFFDKIFKKTKNNVEYFYPKSSNHHYEFIDGAKFTVFFYINRWI